MAILTKQICLRSSKVRGLLVASRASSRHNQRRVDLYRNCFEVLWSHREKWSNISLLCFPRILAHSCSQAPCLPLKASRHEYEYVSGARRHTYPHLRVVMMISLKMNVLSIRKIMMRVKFEKYQQWSSKALLTNGGICLRLTNHFVVRKPVRFSAF